MNFDIPTPTGGESIQYEIIEYNSLIKTEPELEINDSRVENQCYLQNNSDKVENIRKEHNLSKKKKRNIPACKSISTHTSDDDEVEQKLDSPSIENMILDDDNENNSNHINKVLGTFAIELSYQNKKIEELRKEISRRFDRIEAILLNQYGSANLEPQVNDDYILQKLPIDDINELRTFEKNLENLNFSTAMKAHLSELGSYNTASTFKNMMLSLVTENLLSKFTLYGTSEKEKFKQFKNIESIIIDSARDIHDDVHITVFEKFMQSYLKNRNRKGINSGINAVSVLSSAKEPLPPLQPIKQHQEQLPILPPLTKLNHGYDISKVNFYKKLPIDTPEQLKEFDNDLANPVIASALKSHLSLMGSVTTTMTFKRMMSSLITENLLAQYTLHGTSEKERLKQYRNLELVIIESARITHPGLELSVYETFMKHYIKNNPRRRRLS